MGELKVIRKIRGWLAAISATAFILALIPAASIAQWEPAIGGLPPTSHLGFALVEDIDVHQATSYAYIPSPEPGNFQALGVCEVVDEGCVRATGTAVLGPCKGDFDNFCIESVSVAIGEADAQILEFVRTLEGNSFSVAAGKNFPEGRTQSIWQLPGESSSLYTADVSLSFYTLPDGGLGIAGSNFSLYPTEIVSDSNARMPRPRIQENGVMTTGAISVPGCNWTEDGVCGKPLDFTDETKVSLTLRLGPEVSGFFFGRIDGAEISSIEIRPGSNRVTIQGAPMKVPGLRHVAPRSDYKDSTLQALRKLFPYLDLNNLGMLYQPASGPRSIELVQSLASETGDYASGERTVWNLGTGLWVERINPCLKSGTKITGILSTNALAYEGNAPTFNGSFLDYKVAGMHFNPEGEKFLGIYNLSIRSEVARCLYGFKNAPVSATVSVLDENGKPALASTVVSESGGWLRMSAYGFSFSEKRVITRLVQPANKTISSFVESSTTLNSKQKTELRELVGNTLRGGKFICTGIRFESQSMSENIRVRARAKAACDYAKRLNPGLAVWYQTKTTKARNFNGKVLITTKLPAGG